MEKVTVNHKYLPYIVKAAYRNEYLCVICTECRTSRVIHLNTGLTLIDFDDEYHAIVFCKALCETCEQDLKDLTWEDRHGGERYERLKEAIYQHSLKKIVVYDEQKLKCRFAVGIEYII